jgi:predicted nuclease of predicted toxin-antitoxin system
MVPLFIDHDVTDVIVQGVLDHFAKVDLVRSRDVGLAEADDKVILDWAAIHGQVVVSSDANTMPHTDDCEVD